MHSQFKAFRVPKNFRVPNQDGTLPVNMNRYGQQFLSMPTMTRTGDDGMTQQGGHKHEKKIPQVFQSHNYTFLEVIATKILAICKH